MVKRLSGKQDPQIAFQRDYPRFHFREISLKVRAFHEAARDTDLGNRIEGIKEQHFPGNPEMIIRAVIGVIELVQREITLGEFVLPQKHTENIHGIGRRSHGRNSLDMRKKIRNGDIAPGLCLFELFVSFLKRGIMRQNFLIAVKEGPLFQRA